MEIIAKFLEIPVGAASALSPAEPKLKEKIGDLESKMKMESLQRKILTSTFICNKTNWEQEVVALKAQIQDW